MNQVGCDGLLDYLNETIDEETKRAFEQHMEGCEDCRNELSELQSLTEILPFASEPVPPPSGMKSRILENVFATEQEEKIKQNIEQAPSIKNVTNKKRSWLTPLLAASLLFSLLGNSYYFLNKNSPSETPIVQEGTDKVIKVVNLSPSESINANAMASMIDKGDEMALVIQADSLAPLKGTETYQVWLLEDGKPYRAGTFVPNQDGIGGVSYMVKDAGEHSYDTIAITIEPTADSELPQGEIILSSGL
ncbi:anti-sigma factor [Litchfieldia salsa]|uniref:Anti-sigma-W factor RsiW n=1 Tax=Litchfieldia salsa TaxID=930152 RepID=A0A1H0W420_9BACI|nr:anti-sigma factor [Litchfieldia salsa]SDP85484.1 Anti-sigma-K factor RskA [Litchfieldia salsa]